MLDVVLIGAVEGGGYEIDRWDIVLRLNFVRLWANLEQLSGINPIGLLREDF